jgi:hypothetical protein
MENQTDVLIRNIVKSGAEFCRSQEACQVDPTRSIALEDSATDVILTTSVLWYPSSKQGNISSKNF